MTGQCNTVSGEYAFDENTTGHNNTVSGYLALTSNTIGNYNIAIGRAALVLNTEEALSEHAGILGRIEEAEEIGVKLAAVGDPGVAADTATVVKQSLMADSARAPTALVRSVRAAPAALPPAMPRSATPTVATPTAPIRATSCPTTSRNATKCIIVWAPSV
jgi:hypothetical protein